ncbi:hypothetical protein MUO79_03600, partial [Candidatus Bathyarchaeota archaeon]|nr:hypothetical protein [Candidatus Bathyarchaeota archaeon]
LCASCLLSSAFDIRHLSAEGGISNLKSIRLSPDFTIGISDRSLFPESCNLIFDSGLRMFESDCMI